MVRLAFNFGTSAGSPVDVGTELMMRYYTNPADVIVNRFWKLKLNFVQITMESSSKAYLVKTGEL